MDRFSFRQVDLASVNQGKRASNLSRGSTVLWCDISLCIWCKHDQIFRNQNKWMLSYFFSHSIVHCISFMQRFTKGWQLFLQIKFFSSTGYRRIRWSRQLKSMLEVFPFQESSIRCCNMKPLKCTLHELPFVCPVDLWNACDSVILIESSNTKPSEMLVIRLFLSIHTLLHIGSFVPVLTRGFSPKW